MEGGRFDHKEGKDNLRFTKILTEAKDQIDIRLDSIWSYCLMSFGASKLSNEQAKDVILMIFTTKSNFQFSINIH